MSTNLQKLNKKELLEIIGKMKKIELINIINVKQNGGSNSVETEIKNSVKTEIKNSVKTEVKNLVKNSVKNAIRTPLQFNSKLLENEQNNNIHVMSNNKIYNNTYNELNKK
jgi:hypothetical protein